MNLIERLLDSEEHAVESAVPPVAYDAAEAIEFLTIALRRCLEHGLLPVVTHSVDDTVLICKRALAKVEGEA